MIDTCPICNNSLEEMDSFVEMRQSFGCFTCRHHSHLSNFMIQVDKESKELTSYTIYLGKYCIENSFDLNRTIISIQMIEFSKYEKKLFLPLIRFDLYDLDSINRKLNLILTFS